MIAQSRLLFLSSTLLLAALPVAAAEPERRPETEELAPYRAELLEVAFQAATALPPEPHIKTRSRAQESVVEACLELGQPRMAARYIDQILDWRQGAAFADLAFYWAQEGELEEVPTLLRAAEHVALTAPGANQQGWRRDRIRAKIARVHLLMGETDAAARFADELEPSELGDLMALQADLAAPEEFEAQTQVLDATIENGSFEQIRAALEGYSRLYARDYADPERRKLVAGKMEGAWKRLPAPIRIEFLMAMGGAALAHSDTPGALAHVEAAQVLLDAGRWTPDMRLPIAADLAALRHRAGDSERARAELDGALASYDRQRAQIVNIYRAGVLRPLAEAHVVLGDDGAALDVYRLAVEEGVVNPNSRPRATDLSATCVSMAQSGVEPDTDLAARILELLEALSDPW